MGRKSRLKKEKRQETLEFERELRRHPMREEILTCLDKRGVSINQASSLLYVVSLLASLLIHRSIKKQTQLPVISPDEEKADEKRFEGLGKVLDYECRQLQIEPQEIMNELVLPMVGNKALMEPILRRIFEMFDPLVSSGNLRQTTDPQIENPELWGDSLQHYTKLKEEYSQAVEKLFSLVLDIARSTLEEELAKTDHEKRLDEIRETYGIGTDDFEKLRRRATEFYKIAFAKYMSILLQPIRDEVDEKVLVRWNFQVVEQ